MKTYTISILAREFGLSRSTLLYYDREGLLKPTARTASGYRLYTTKDYRLLERICTFRQAGLSIADIQTLLAKCKSASAVLEGRLHKTGRDIAALRNQQRLLSSLMKRITSGGCPPSVDKAMWIEMLRAVGMDDGAMERWHAEFERRTPQGHHDFLASLGISETEISQIRAWARNKSIAKNS